MSPESGPEGVRRALQVVVVQHFKLNDKDAAFCADWIQSQLDFGDRFIDRPKDIAGLERMDRALLDFGLAFSQAAVSTGTLERLKVALLSGPHTGRKDETEVEEWRSYVATYGQSDLDALERLAGRWDAIRAAISVTADEVDRDPYSKRTLSRLDGRAIGVVQGCRNVWQYCKGRAAPARDLNEASPFAKFLTEAMRACGIDDPKPVPAFRAWVRESQKVPRSRQK